MLFWLSFLLASAQAQFAVPALTGPVVDQARMLSPQTEAKMSEFLRALRAAGGTQLQVLTVPDLGGLAIEEASIKVTDQWKLGSAKNDDGILLMVAAKERRVRIEVGQGREGVLPDVVASRIIRDVIVPRFREGNADQAITAGIFAILHYTDPEFLESSGVRAPRGERVLNISPGLLFFIIICFFIFVMLPIGRLGRRRSIWRGTSGYGGWNSGGGWGGFGGGFGGGGGWSGGGGGFSGGGSSGGW